MTDADEARPTVAAAIVVAGGRVLMIRRRVAEGGLSWPAAVAEVEWCDRAAVTERVPYPLYGPVADYLAPLLA